MIPPGPHPPYRWTNSVPNREKGNCIQPLLTGCFLVAVIVAMVMLGTWFYMRQHGPEVFSGFLLDFVEKTVSESSLSEAEKEAIRKEIERLETALEAGEIQAEDLLRLSDAFGEGAFFLAFKLDRIEQEWIPQSGLTEAEKAEGVQVLHRTRRGLIEGRYDRNQFLFVKKALPLESDGWGSEQLINSPTDHGISNLIGDLKILADQAGIPEDDESIDEVALVRKLVNDILGEGDSRPETDPSLEGDESAALEGE